MLPRWKSDTFPLRGNSIPQGDESSTLSIRKSWACEAGNHRNTRNNRSFPAPLNAPVWLYQLRVLIRFLLIKKKKKEEKGEVRKNRNSCGCCGCKLPGALWNEMQTCAEVFLKLQIYYSILQALIRSLRCEDRSSISDKNAIIRVRKMCDFQL